MTREKIGALETMNVDKAIRIVRESCPDQYATKYAENIPEVIREFGTKGLCYQIGYILANTSNWHGKDAKRAKKALRDYFNKYIKQERTIDNKRYKS
ncbi:hypothetical protein J4229_03485 [Candidatus Pacearchaeota archaeon]|nr:hypothetical protein [Candidatus Pacearchaeota archaeon]